MYSIFNVYIRTFNSPNISMQKIFDAKLLTLRNVEKARVDDDAMLAVEVRNGEGEDDVRVDRAYEEFGPVEKREEVTLVGAAVASPDSDDGTAISGWVGDWAHVVTAANSGD